MKKLLITGFQPFDGESVNPSLEIVKRIAGRAVNGYELVAREVPVVRYESVETLRRAVDEIRPDAVIIVGQAAGRPDITVERIGINVDDFRIPDNEGNKPVDEPVAADGPIAYWATLPIKKMVDHMKAAGIPAQRGEAHIPAGFVHIPFLPEQMAGRTGLESQYPTMSAEALEKAFAAMIEALP